MFCGSFISQTSVDSLSKQNHRALRVIKAPCRITRSSDDTTVSGVQTNSPVTSESDSLSASCSVSSSQTSFALSVSRPSISVFKAVHRHKTDPKRIRCRIVALLPKKSAYLSRNSVNPSQKQTVSGAYSSGISSEDKIRLSLSISSGQTV